MAPEDLFEVQVNLESCSIEYRKITIEDFPEDIYEFEKIDSLEADENGFLTDRIKENISDELNTTVVNVGTGQGKTTAIIQAIEEFYNNEPDYFIIVASPTKALVSKYYGKISDALSEIFPSDRIIHYEEIAANSVYRFSRNNRILIGTINMLLGNPGEDSFLQSQQKRDYLESVRRFCRDLNIKVILILDEIHESVDSYKPQFYPNLLKWRDITHKVVVLSATYTEWKNRTN